MLVLMFEEWIYSCHIIRFRRIAIVSYTKQTEDAATDDAKAQKAGNNSVINHEIK